MKKCKNCEHEVTEQEFVFVQDNEHFQQGDDEVNNRHLKCGCVVTGELGSECGCEFA